MNLVADGLFRHPDFRQESCNWMTLEVTLARAWINDIKVGIIDNEWFRSIAHCLANPSSTSFPSTPATTEHELWVLVHLLFLEVNGLLWLRGDFEQKQVEDNARAKKMDTEEGLEITVTEQEKEDELKDKEGVEITVKANDNEGDGNADRRGQLCIPKMMQ